MVELLNNNTITSKEDIDCYQLRRLQELVTRAESNHFFGPLMDKMRIRAEDIRSLEDIRRFPIIRKNDLVNDVQETPPFGKRLQVTADQISHIVETSGTSGNGVEVHAMTLQDEQDIATMESIGFSWAGISKGVRVLKTIPMGVTAAGIWYHYGLKKLGANVLEVGMYPTTKKVEYLLRYACEAIIATPSYLKRLSMAVKETGSDPATLGVKRLITATEPYSIKMARDLENEWGAKLYEQYGSTERAMAWSCNKGAIHNEKKGMLHFLPEFCLYEVLDPDSLEPVKPGEFGELVITPFIGEASPLIRFGTGDKVRLLPREACDCGNYSSGIEAGSVNRYDRMLKIRGVNVWPEAIDAIVFSYPEVQEYQGRVLIDEMTGAEQVLISIEWKPEHRINDVLLQDIAEAIRKKIGLRVNVSSWEGQPLLLSRDEAGRKYSRWEDQRKE